MVWLSVGSQFTPIPEITSSLVLGFVTSREMLLIKSYRNIGHWPVLLIHDIDCVYYLFYVLCSRRLDFLELLSVAFEVKIDGC